MPALLLRFGLFELNTGSRALHKQGRRVRLQEQPLRILEVLLERPGELVTRQELIKRLWPSDVHVDFEIGLNGAIKRLRLALDDSSDNPIFIETVPKQGYRFLAPVQKVAAPEAPAGRRASDLSSAGIDGSDTAMQVAARGSVTAARTDNSNSSRSNWVSIAISAAVIAAVAAYLLRPLTPPLRVTRIVKLSNTGQALTQENLSSDGPRLYYTAYNFGANSQFRQILLNGNEDTLVAGISPDSAIRSLSPDGTMFLGISRLEIKDGRASPVWVQPVIGGPVRRVGNFLADDAAWSADGGSLVFGRGNQLFVAGRDGAGERKLVEATGNISHPRWSPNGRRIRFTVTGAQSERTIWEVAEDGSHLQQLDFHWPGISEEGFGEWTADGRYYVFVSRRDGVSNLWAIEDETNWLHRVRHDPIQLTAGPINYSRPLPSRDGSRIFALGTQVAGELLRYDATRKDFVQFLGGLSADHVDFTRDGMWMTYVSYPEGSLWRARADGSQQLQLTFPPQRALNPRWSPDGKRILFVTRRPGELPKIYTISIDGGSAEPVVSETHAQTSASWSPQGDFIFYGRDFYGENQDLSLYRVDVRSGRSEKIPGADKLFSPICSPDGRYLVAQSAAGDHQLVLLDLSNGTRRVLSEQKADYPAWSADSQYLYFNTFVGDEPAIYSVHVVDGKIHKVTVLPFRPTGSYGSWSGLAPDGSPLVFRSREQTDVYALVLR
jgi:Tol biopolymer transport system component/DNA-binding winged helix-turn-helix (wHTH) protein